MPCSNGKCPFGTTCKAGICRTLTPPEQLKKDASDKVLDKGKEAIKDQVQERALELLSKTLFELSRSFGGKIVTGFVGGMLEPTMLATDRDLYRSELGYVANDVSSLKALFQEYDNYLAGKPARAMMYIKADIERKKAEFSDHVQQLNIGYDAVVKQKELHSDECYEVFEYQQQKVNQVFANFIVSH